MSITERIDDILQEKGMSRRALAHAAMIPPSTLQSAMSRGGNMSYETLSAIAKGLGTTVEYLSGTSDIRYPFVNMLTEINKYGVTFQDIAWEMGISPFNMDELMAYRATKPQLYEKILAVAHLLCQIHAREGQVADVKNGPNDPEFLSLSEAYFSMNQEGRMEAVKRVQEMSELGKYRKE